MAKKTTFYIAGPVSGVNRYWEPFDKAEQELTRRGYVVLNPTRLPSDLPEDRIMPICLAMVDAADAVLLLPGWEKSEGAKIEKLYAERLGKSVVPLAEFNRSVDVFMDIFGRTKK